MAGIFILYPANEFVYFEEYGSAQVTTTANSALDFMFEQMKRSLSGQTPRKTTFYAAVGILLSIPRSSPACIAA